VHQNNAIVCNVCSRGAYEDQEEEQSLSGLGQAVTLKSRGVTYKVPFVCTWAVKINDQLID